MECSFRHSHFLEVQGEKELGIGGEEGIFCVFLSIINLSLFKHEGREDLKRAKGPGANCSSKGSRIWA